MVATRSALAVLGLSLMLFVAPATAAAASLGYKITIESGAFSPAQLTIPAGKRVKVMVHNKTALPAEFESYDFTVEKVVPGGTTVPVYIGPLKPGQYGFFNDFAANVKGRLTVGK